MHAGLREPRPQLAERFDRSIELDSVRDETGTDP